MLLSVQLGIGALRLVCGDKRADSDVPALLTCFRLCLRLAGALLCGWSGGGRGEGSVLLCCAGRHLRLELLHLLGELLHQLFITSRLRLPELLLGLQEFVGCWESVCRHRGTQH